jgi:phosphoribosylglycinamide formyltransferase-1
MRVSLCVFYVRQVVRMNILVLVSGGGTNLQALIDAEKAGRLEPGRIVGVISDRRSAYALERAKSAGIPAMVEKADSGLSDRLLRGAREMDAGLIILAGFLSILEGEIIRAYGGRIVNLHPSLLPKFGGAGMYGERVHQAVLAAGETESGCTVHLVDAGTDSGPILLQRKVPVLPTDTADSLAERIHKEEHIAIVEGTTLMVERLSARFR